MLIACVLAKQEPVSVSEKFAKGRPVRSWMAMASGISGPRSVPLKRKRASQEAFGLMGFTHLVYACLKPLQSGLVVRAALSQNHRHSADCTIWGADNSAEGLMSCQCLPTHGLQKQDELHEHCIRRWGIKVCLKNGCHSGHEILYDLVHQGHACPRKESRHRCSSTCVQCDMLELTWMNMGSEVPQATTPSTPEISQSRAAKGAHSAFSWAAARQGTSLPATLALSAQSPANGNVNCSAYVPSQLSVTDACTQQVCLRWCALAAGACYRYPHQRQFAGTAGKRQLIWCFARRFARLRGTIVGKYGHRWQQVCSNLDCGGNAAGWAALDLRSHILTPEDPRVAETVHSVEHNRCQLSTCDTLHYHKHKPSLPPLLLRRSRPAALLSSARCLP